MTNKIKELVAAGHALAKELHCSESAALVRELATQLDVQRARADVLAVDNENALSVLKEANLSVLRAKASFEAMWLRMMRLVIRCRRSVMWLAITRMPSAKKSAKREPE